MDYPVAEALPDNVTVIWMTSCGERSSEPRCQQSKSQSSWCGMTTNTQMGPLLPWVRGKPMAWDVTVSDTYAESHIGNTATKPGAAAQKTAQNKIDKYSKLASTLYLLPIWHRNSWYMAWDGHWAHTRDWHAYHHYHRRHPGDSIPFPTPFHGSAKRKCGFFPQHHGNRVNCRCNHNFVCLA